jgi:CRP-like cAMP-binding protein
MHILANILFESNRLLKSIGASARHQFAPRLQPIEMDRGDVIHHTGDDVEWVYFPQKGLVALLSETTAGESVESGLIGPDGAVGIFEACGSRKLLSTAVVRVPCIAVRVSAASYRELFASCPGLRTAVHRHVEILMAEGRQFVICNALHSVEARLARAILDALDKSRLTTILPVTQDSLAQALGAQRTTIAAQISSLQRRGVIRSGRGAIEIPDREKLEQLACSCRETLEYARQAIYAPEQPACDELLTA